MQIAIAIIVIAMSISVTISDIMFTSFACLSEKQTSHSDM